jgi:hypothetical protein
MRVQWRAAAAAARFGNPFFHRISCCFPTIPPGMPVHTVHPLPFPSIGTARTLDVFTYGPLDSPRSVYIQASLHADELPGTCAKLRVITIMQRL